MSLVEKAEKILDKADAEIAKLDAKLEPKLDKAGSWLDANYGKVLAGITVALGLIALIALAVA